MLFIYYNKANALEGCKYSRSGSDRHLHLTAADFSPFIVTLAIRQSAVHHRHRIAEAPLEALHHLRR
ncbi:hypothetical protein D3C78_1040280 [compost metagenome]